MKGLSLEIPIGLADVVVCAESNITVFVMQEYRGAPGSETIACYTLIYRSQLEDPVTSSNEVGRMQVIIKQASLMAQEVGLLHSTEETG